MDYSVGQVAGFAGITVRTLHHYDGIGLLSPCGRSHAGHRRYDDGDLDRLQQILFYRELGFPLDDIAVLLDDPEADPREHLRRRHALLSERIAALRKMAAAVETAMEAKRMGIDLTPEEKFEVFGGADPEEYAQESQRRWGGTETYAESQRRVARHTKDDWKRMRAEAAGWGKRYDALMEAGEPATGERAMDLAEAHRQHITTWFYDCTLTIHRGLGEMYVADPRFRAYYESIRPGLAEHLRDAIEANAERRA
ncbi:MerR family transcriptional regulator [Streptomyces fulvorobeus]|uniref:DNA-binding transcriptional MerR regulator n=1 Tax=Streptomyces fulvorobeus TaxID=284028 RepID=A0A7J0C6U9_9ACTN|nr:MerR family transcriptional regulator [Streptomyces fulvorobeus]NYE41524.1 DNA-binding transcriptional MerR regulator [Streptomyces fulvorobeus]GFM97887.1 HTH-type transcriptional activator TipA [Streptomyces fulvorobeus]